MALYEVYNQDINNSLEDFRFCNLEPHRIVKPAAVLTHTDTLELWLEVNSSPMSKTVTKF